jgi:hypothetical protein
LNAAVSKTAAPQMGALPRTASEAALNAVFRMVARKIRRRQIALAADSLPLQTAQNRLIRGRTGAYLARTGPFG